MAAAQMLARHLANYDRVRDSLSDLTPIRNGVPFERDRRYQGCLPVVWANALTQVP